MRLKALNFLREISPDSQNSNSSKFLPYSIERDSIGKIILTNSDTKNKGNYNHFFPKRKTTILQTSRTEPSSNITFLPQIESNQLNTNREYSYQYKEQMQAKAFGDLFNKKFNHEIIRLKEDDPYQRHFKWNMNQQDRKVNEEILKSIKTEKKPQKIPFLKTNHLNSPGIGYYEPSYESIKKKSISTFISQTKQIKQEKEIPSPVKEPKKKKQINRSPSQFEQMLNYLQRQIGREVEQEIRASTKLLNPLERLSQKVQDDRFVTEFHQNIKNKIYESQLIKKRMKSNLELMSQQIKGK